MFNLMVAYVNQAEREREIESGLRRRQVLNTQEPTASPIEPPARTARRAQAIASPRATSIRARAAGR